MLCPIGRRPSISHAVYVCRPSISHAVYVCPIGRRPSISHAVYVCRLSISHAVYVCPIGRRPSISHAVYVCPIGRRPSISHAVYVCPIGRRPSISHAVYVYPIGRRLTFTPPLSQALLKRSAQLVVYDSVPIWQTHVACLLNTHDYFTRTLSLLAGLETSPSRTKPHSAIRIRGYGCHGNNHPSRSQPHPSLSSHPHLSPAALALPSRGHLVTPSPNSHPARRPCPLSGRLPRPLS